MSDSDSLQPDAEDQAVLICGVEQFGKCFSESNELEIKRECNCDSGRTRK